jgi:hypothetical protein
MMRIFTTAGGRTRTATIVTLLAVLLICAAAVGLAGCGKGAAPSTTSTGSSETTVSTQGGDTTTVSQSGPTTTAAGLGQDPVYDHRLATTALAENRLAIYLQNQNVAQNDPRIGLLYGLRAQEDALTARKALSQKSYSIADSAMQEVYATTSLGRTVATGTVLATLDSGYKTIENLGHPSASPDSAATLLDTFISQLDPLIAQANAVDGASTSTTSATGSATTGSS